MNPVPSPLSFITSPAHSPWSTYLAQVDRVMPYLGRLAGWGTATYAVACERILMAREERGLYP